MSPSVNYKLQVVLEPSGEVQIITGVTRLSTIQQLKFKIESVFGIPSFLVDLYYLDECALVDDEQLSYYHILPDAKLKAQVWRYSDKLITAARAGSLEGVRESINEYQWNCNGTTERGDRALWALFIGCFHGHDEMVAYLLKEGVKYRRCLPSGLDAIQVAATRGHIKCVELLLGRKVRPHEWNFERMSLTCWGLQDRIKSTLDRIEKTTTIQSNVLSSRLTNSQKYDSALSTWYNGEHGQIYLCQILDKENDENKEKTGTKPVFRP